MQARSNQLPFAVEAAVVEAAGKAFWYKRPLLSLMQRAGVPGPLLEQYQHESKYVIAREIWGELHDRGSAGAQIQRQIVRNLAGLKTFGDDVDAGEAKAAIKTLRQIAEENGVIAPNASALDSEISRREAKKKREKYDRDVHSKVARTEKLHALNGRLGELVRDSSDPQKRGLSLEPLLGELISFEGLPYEKPFRKSSVTQTDGFFSFDSFQYLIEARWRKSAPDVAAFNAFGSKIHSTFQSTRGLFLSMAGFRDDAVTESSRTHRNIILMSGAELALILDGRFTFKSALRQKVDEAARTGTLFFDLA